MEHEEEKIEHNWEYIERLRKSAELMRTVLVNLVGTDNVDELTAMKMCIPESEVAVQAAIDVLLMVRPRFGDASTQVPASAASAQA